MWKEDREAHLDPQRDLGITVVSMPLAQWLGCSAGTWETLVQFPSLSVEYKRFEQVSALITAVKRVLLILSLTQLIFNYSGTASTREAESPVSQYTVVQWLECSPEWQGTSIQISPHPNCLVWILGILRACLLDRALWG